MLTTKEFIRLFTIENDLIKEQTAGLTQADSLIQPQPSGNCLNWVLGHILENQITLLKALGGVFLFDPAVLEIYKRGSDPITMLRPEVLAIEDLLSGIEMFHQALVHRLSEMNPSDFEREIQVGERKTTLAWRLFFLNFHYTYHVGQLELLRQLAGHSDKIV